MKVIINMFILLQIRSLCRYFDNNLDRYPITKKNNKEDIEAPIPKQYLLITRKFLEKFPRKKTVSE